MRSSLELILVTVSSRLMIEFHVHSVSYSVGLSVVSDHKFWKNG